MTFYLGSKREVPIIDWDQNNPSFNTEKLNNEDSKISKYFSLPYVNYIGSDQHCGCGFNHALISDGNWLLVESEDDDWKINHKKLFEFVLTNLSDTEYVEIYGCWNGDSQLSPLNSEVVGLEEILHEGFFFKEQVFYKLEIKKQTHNK